MTCCLADFGQKQLNELNQVISNAEENLPFLDRDMLNSAQKGIRLKHKERENLKELLRAAKLPRKRLREQCENRVDAALRKLFQLREAFEAADNQMVREFLQLAVDHVALWCEKQGSGARAPFQLRRRENHANSRRQPGRFINMGYKWAAQYLQ